jgi:hypothetical protein
VALKYGISLTELRRFNQLWTTDSIHLRNVLYVPVSTSRAQSYLTQTPDTPTPTIRRMPISRLAFFPPQSTKPAPSPQLTPPPSPPHERCSQSRSTLSPKRHHSRFAPFYSTTRSSSPQRTLSSIFAAMPIASRLSFDSSRSGSDEGMEHELDDVGSRPEKELHPRLPSVPPPRPSPPLPSSSSYPPPISSLLRERKLGEPSLSSSSSSSSLRHGLDRRGFATTAVYSAPTLSSTPPAPRTVQLEPSPAMQLPVLNRKERVREPDLIDL